MPRQNSPEDARNMSAEQRAERRKRVLNMLASAAQDAGHRRQMFEFQGLRVGPLQVSEMRVSAPRR